jgi:drug/metabolite transporter (DMT)-like permease
MIGDLLGLASALTWALVSVLLRGLQSRTDALSLNALRSLVATLLALAAVVVTGRLGDLGDVPFPTVGLLVASVLVGMGIGDTIYFYSLRLVGVARGLLLSNAYPIYAAVMAAALLGERVGPGLVAGTLLVVFGVGLVLIPGRALHAKPGAVSVESERLGVMLALLAGFFWACATVLARAGVQEVDGLVAATIRLFAATVALLLASSFSRQGLQLKEYKGAHLAGTVAAGVAGLLSSVTFLLAAQLTGAAKTATLTSTAPLFGVPMSLMLGEKMTWQMALGCLASVAGIWLVVTA